MLSSSKSGKCPHCLRQIEHSSQFFEILANTNATPTKKMLNKYLKTIHLKWGQIVSLMGAPTLFSFLLLLRLSREVSQRDICSLSFSRTCSF